MFVLRFLLLLPFRLVGGVARFLGWLMGIGVCKKVCSGQEYEEYVCTYLKRQGYTRIQHTGGTGDLGVDLVARRGGHRCAVQCKFYSSPVGGGAVQEVVAGMPVYQCDRALIVTNSTLTRGAWTLARSNGVEVLEHIAPENDAGLLSAQTLVTPANLVAFTLGCVAAGAVLNRVMEQHRLTVSSGCLLGGVCLFGCWCAVHLVTFLVRRVLEE